MAQRAPHPYSKGVFYPSMIRTISFYKHVARRLQEIKNLFYA